MGACWKDYSCPTNSVWSCIVLTLTASVFHGIALIFHYWTDHETFCEIDLLKRNETCRVQQGLWEYCEKYKKLGIELCSYEHLDSWVRVVAVFSCLGMVFIICSCLCNVGTSCRGWKHKYHRYTLLVGLFAAVWITSDVVIYGIKSVTKDFHFCFFFDIVAACLAGVATLFHFIRMRQLPEGSLNERLISAK